MAAGAFFVLEGVNETPPRGPVRPAKEGEADPDGPASFGALSSLKGLVYFENGHVYLGVERLLCKNHHRP